MAKRLLVILVHPPYGHENSFAGFFIAMAALSKGMDVALLLNCDGVFTAVKNQMDPEQLLSLPSIENQIKDILEMGGRVIVDKSSADIRGIRQEDSISGLEFVADDEVAKIIDDYGELMVTL